MHAQTSPSPPADAYQGHMMRLVPLLQEAGLTVAMQGGAIMEVANPRDARIKQLIVLRERDDGPWWAWVWSGPTRDADPELEPMVPAEHVDEAARRIANVLRIDQTEGAER